MHSACDFLMYVAYKNFRILVTIVKFFFEKELHNKTNSFILFYLDYKIKFRTNYLLNYYTKFSFKIFVSDLSIAIELLILSVDLL